MGKEGEGARKLVFGKYEMGRVLGKGTFAKVYYGREISSGESVAIKVIDKERVSREAGMMEQIQREIAVMRMVRHPNVVELREVMATRSRIFFVMDRGVYHRDLKPENLLLDGHGDLKVSDFGLSALPEQLRHDGLLHTQCGTPAYVAPEILRHRGYDGAKADLWSCGVILFALLAGNLPFQDESLTAMYCKVFKAEYRIPPWFSREARRLVSRLLVVDPEKRISITAVMQHPWFKKGPRGPAPIQIPPPPPKAPEEEEEDNPRTPRFYNAFELISSMSSGFNLSSLFESQRKAGTVFTSRSPASAIVKMEGKAEGRKGRLAVAAEVFEVAAGIAVVEFAKTSGDTLEYAKFCNEGVRPGLKDIVWTWQGDDTASVGGATNGDIDLLGFLILIDVGAMSSILPKSETVEIREVWSDNLEAEFALIREIVDDFPYVAMDTEFPGIVCRPLGCFRTSSDFNYATLKANVDMLKLIQLGLTFSDELGNLPTCGTDRGCVWQFNFREFDMQLDVFATDSIELLRQSGIDFKKNNDKGIDAHRFGELLMSSGIVLNDSIYWVTFHSGIYFPTVYDIKHLMKFCNSLHGGLNKLAELLDVERVGICHQAGSDSLLTSCAFRKLKESFFSGSTERYAGVLYGLSVENGQTAH
ncbi:unnamed protein product [Musa hybrid cultivar]